MTTPSSPKSPIDLDTVRKLSQLCKIGCSPTEIEAILTDLKKILSYIDQLNEIDATDVPPCHQVLSYAHTVQREDCIGTPLKRELLLKNAPDQGAGMIKVPTVIDKGA